MRLFMMYSAGLGLFLPWFGGDDEPLPTNDLGSVAVKAEARPVLLLKMPRLVGDLDNNGGGKSLSPRNVLLFVGGVSPQEYELVAGSPLQRNSSEA
jgi:hypothetical protein